jgi:hypothetical protein
VPRADRDAKPISRSVNFGCAKLFISQDRPARVFQCGLQVERGAESAGYGSTRSGNTPYRGAGSGAGEVVLQEDWDWHRLMRQCAAHTPLDFQLYYPMPEQEVRATGGYDFVQAIMGAFSEVIPAMNLCMQVTLAPARPLNAPGRGSAIPSGTAQGTRPRASRR